MKNIEKKRLKNTDDQNLRDVLSYIKWSNVRLIGIPGGDERGNEVEKIFEETLSKNLQIQDAK